MKLVAIESPYAGDVGRNLKYARRAMRDSIKREEAPIASHLLYTQEGILNDNIQEERLSGIMCGLEWARKADYAVFYVDYGWSSGMLTAAGFYDLNNIRYETRLIGQNDEVENEEK